VSVELVDHICFLITALQALIADLSSADSFSLRVLHASEIISEAEVTVILDHFEVALLFLIEHPHESVCNVELINDSEMRRLIHDHTNPVHHPNPVQNVSELIETQASRTPKKIAVRISSCLFQCLHLQ
jgi:hypothetical protein